MNNLDQVQKHTGFQDLGISDNRVENNRPLGMVGIHRDDTGMMVDPHCR